jgi:hypothetical protein
MLIITAVMMKTRAPSIRVTEQAAACSVLQYFGEHQPVGPMVLG